MKVTQFLYSLYLELISKLGRSHKRSYPHRQRETCICGREITKCKNGRFVRHTCKASIDPKSPHDLAAVISGGEPC